MLTNLPESRARRTRRLAGTITSLGVHVVLVAAAIALTMTSSAGANVAPRVPPAPVVYVVPQSHRLASPAGPAGEASPAALPVLPPPTLPRLIVPVGDLRLDDVVHAPELPDALGAGRVLSALGGALPGAAGTGRDAEIVDEREADRAPRLLGAPQPRYPESLRAAGITGRVVTQFVVDTAGLAEPATLEVLSATRVEFANAVRAALPRLRFAPGEAGRRRARVRVQLPFDFALQ